MMVLWKLMVRLARRLCIPELILSSTVPILSFYSPEPLKKLLSSPGDCWALSYPRSAPPAALHHSPAEQRHRPAVTPSLMAGAMKHWYDFYGKPLVSCPKGLDFCCNKEAALHHMNAPQLLAILIINVRPVFITLLSAGTFWPFCSISKAVKAFKTWLL